MPYTYKKQGDKYCVYKKHGGKKVGCTAGNKTALKKYMAALHMAESIRSIVKEEVTAVLNEEQKNYMFFQNLKNIKDAAEAMLAMDPAMVDTILNDDHDWASDHVATSWDDIGEVYHFLKHKVQ